MMSPLFVRCSWVVVGRWVVPTDVLAMFQLDNVRIGCKMYSGASGTTLATASTQGVN